MTAEARTFASSHARGLRLLALLSVALGVFGAVFVVSGATWWWMSPSLLAMALSAINLWLLSRSRTVIDGDGVSIRQGVRERRVPLTDVQEVVHPSRWGPVSLRLRSGTVLSLPMVQPEDADEVRRLLRIS